MQHIEEKPYLSSIWSNEKEGAANEMNEVTLPPGVHEFDFNANWGHEYLKEGPPHFA